MDFYLESIQQLPAIIDRGPAEKENIARTFSEFVDLAHLYESAIEVVKTYLGILDSEFSIKYQRNPIHDIKSRLKSAESIIGKLNKKGIPLTPENARKNLLDIAGIRVTCYYISDIYVLAEMLSHRDDFIVIKQKDYIKDPKPSGYRSYHMIINVPVYLAAQKRYAPVEIQIRTIAMDFWASLEHKIHYKFEGNAPDNIKNDLAICAKMVAALDDKMLSLNEEIISMNAIEEDY
jgi:putative GTP pyrophosphokinase